jgi:nicotinate-nucleotide adenylyltransferase
MSVALVFGGTFDPPHRGHVAIARSAADLVGAGSILVLPAAVNPQRTGTPPSPAADRLAMARIAFRNEPRAEILDLEVGRGGPSYTIDTLRELAKLRPDTRFRLLIGSDQAVNFTTWREWREVERLAEPAIVVRPPHDAATLAGELRRLHGAEADRWIARILPIAPTPERSTAIRAELAAGRVPDDLDPEVARYVAERGRPGKTAGA